MATMQITGAAVGTIDLNDNVNCQVAMPGWVPAVSKRRRSAMGNQGLYEDAVETIPLRVFSANANPATARQAVMNWLGNLAAAMEQAKLWEEGPGNIDAVLFEYEPDNSSLANPQKAAILGVPEEARGVLEFQGSFNIGLGVYEVMVELTFVRMGAWLGDEVSATADGAVACTMPDDVDLGSDLKLPSPVDLTLEVTNMTTTSPRGFLVVTDDIDDLYVARGSDRTGSISNGSNSGSTVKLYPRSTSGGIWTAATTGQMLLGFSIESAVASGSLANARMYEVILSIHLTAGNGVSADYLYHTLGTGTPASSDVVSMRPVTITPDNAGDPNFISLGLLAVPKTADYTSPYIQIRFNSIDGGSNTILVDVVAIIRRDRQQTMVIGLNETPLDTRGENDLLLFRHNMLSDIQPTYSADGTDPAASIPTGVFACGAEGDLAIMNTGRNPAAVLLATTEDYWRFGNGTGVASTTLTMARRPAYLVPQ